jgi:hypothetical protein
MNTNFWVKEWKWCSPLTPTVRLSSFWTTLRNFHPRQSSRIVVIVLTTSIVTMDTPFSPSSDAGKDKLWLRIISHNIVVETQFTDPLVENCILHSVRFVACTVQVLYFWSWISLTSDPVDIILLLLVRNVILSWKRWRSCTILFYLVCIHFVQTFAVFVILPV